MTVILNDGPEPFVRQRDDEELVVGLISGIVDLSPSFRIKLDRSETGAVNDLQTLFAHAKGLISLNEKADIRMCLRHFSFDNHQRVPPQIAEHFLNQSALGREIVELFEKIGIVEKIYGNLQRKDSRSTYRRYYIVYISGLLMCTSGAKQFAEIDRDIIYRWLAYYYNFDKRSFNRPDLIHTQLNIHRRILKELAKGLGGYLNDREIIELGLTRRIYPASAIFGPADERPHLEKWLSLWKKWRSTQPPLSKAPTSSLNYLCDYLDYYGSVCADPRTFLSAPRDKSLLDLYQSRRIEKGLSAIPGSDEFPLLHRFSRFVTTQFQLIVHPIYELVTAEDDREFKSLRKKFGLNERLAEAAATPLATRYYKLMREILEEGESGWPGRHPLCRAVIAGIDRYVPVLPTLYLVLFEIPLRTVTVRRFDSGEGDKESFDGHRLVWVENLSPHAGYWQKTERSNPFRGYARRTNSPNITGIFINTNKHSR